jgi:hypothetical protein
VVGFFFAHFGNFPHKITHWGTTLKNNKIFVSIRLTQSVSTDMALFCNKHLPFQKLLRQNIAICLCFVFGLSAVQAQTQWDWGLHFHGFADNREFVNVGLPSKTLFGVRITPEIGLRFEEEHRIRVGATFIQEFGYNHQKIKPILYYQYQKGGHLFQLGAFTRYGLIEDFPRALMADTLLYDRPQVEGMLWKFQRKKFYQQIWIDWNSRQTDHQREEFIAGWSGKIPLANFYLGHSAMLWHQAHRKIRLPDDRIRDNASFQIKFGYERKQWLGLDSIDLHLSYIQAFDRLRSVYDWQKPMGGLAHLHLRYRSFYVENTYYDGEALPLPFGDPFYRSEQYNRAELGWIPLKNKTIEAKLALSLHFTEDAIDNQQQFTLRYHIGRGFKKGSIR